VFLVFLGCVGRGGWVLVLSGLFHCLFCCGNGCVGFEFVFR